MPPTEAEREPVQALVFVGDCVEENVDELGQLAGELGLLGMRAFLFHEGRDARAAQAFRHVARAHPGRLFPVHQRLGRASCARCSAASPPTPPAAERR